MGGVQRQSILTKQLVQTLKWDKRTQRQGMISLLKKGKDAKNCNTTCIFLLKATKTTTFCVFLLLKSQSTELCDNSA